MALEYVEITSEIEIKTDVKRDEKTGQPYNSFEGYASAFKVVDNGEDRIHKGTFLDTLKARGPRFDNKGRLRSDIKILEQHNPYIPLGLPEHMAEDDYGLWSVGRINHTSRGKDMIILLQAGVIDKMSIGFRLTKHDWEKDEDSGRTIRNIYGAKLYEYSPVTFPMNESADITGVKDLLAFGGKKFYVVDLDLTEEKKAEVAQSIGVDVSVIKDVLIKTEARSEEEEESVLLPAPTSNLSLGYDLEQVKDVLVDEEGVQELQEEPEVLEPSIDDVKELLDELTSALLEKKFFEVESSSEEVEEKSVDFSGIDAEAVEESAKSAVKLFKSWALSQITTKEEHENA